MTDGEWNAALRERVAALEAKILAFGEMLLISKTDLDRRLTEVNYFRDLYEREHDVLADRVGQLEQNRTLNRDFNEAKNDIQELKQYHAGALGMLGAYGTVITFLLAVAALIVAFTRGH